MHLRVPHVAYGLFGDGAVWAMDLFSNQLLLVEVLLNILIVVHKRVKLKFLLAWARLIMSCLIQIVLQNIVEGLILGVQEGERSEAFHEVLLLSFSYPIVHLLLDLRPHPSLQDSERVYCGDTFLRLEIIIEVASLHFV